jgi:hypothetical protein
VTSGRNTWDVTSGAYSAAFLPPLSSLATLFAGNMAVELPSTAQRVRRRSLKAFLQLPVVPRPLVFAHSTISSTSIAGVYVSLPEDILRTIVEELEPREILSLSLTVRLVALCPTPPSDKTLLH